MGGERESERERVVWVYGVLFSAAVQQVLGWLVHACFYLFATPLPGLVLVVSSFVLRASAVSDGFCCQRALEVSLWVSCVLAPICKSAVFFAVHRL